MLLERGSKTGVVLLDGPPVSEALLERWCEEADLFVCADGAGGRDLPRAPDLIIGDMDSLANPPEGVPLLRDTNPDRCDAEKCLQYLLNEGCDRFIVLGGFGARADHSLVNLSLPLFRCGEVMLADDDFCARGVEGAIRLQLPPDRNLSVFPLHGAVGGVSLSGAAFNLSGERLDFPRGKTASNRTTDSPLLLGAGTGRLLLIVETRAEDPLWQE